MKRTTLGIIAVFFALAACGKKDQPAAQPEGQAAITTTTIPDLKKGKGPAPYIKKDTYFKLPNAAGGDIDLAAYAGKPVLIMFFTETCPYCRKAAPFIQKVSVSYASKGLPVLGVCIQDSPRAALDFAADLGVTFPLAYKGQEISRSYRAQGVPYIYLLTKDHEIYDVWEGYDPQYDASILKAMETVLAKN